MATSDSEDKSSEVNFNHTIQSLEETPWIAYAAEQAQLFKKNVTETVDSAFVTAKSRFSEIRMTSSAHFNQTLDSLEEIKNEYVVYEDLVFGKLKEGVFLAASNPVVTCGAAVGLGLLVAKRPRRYLTSSISRIFVSEEAVLSKAHDKFKQLEESVELVKSQTMALQEESMGGQEVFNRGKKKLRQTGKQIQGALSKAYKVEGQARGLKIFVKELPSGQASEFGKTVKDLGNEAKIQRKELNKEVSRIVNLGIPI